MISAAQLAQFRATAHAALAEVFATTITIGEHAAIPAARWSASRAAAPQGIGTLLPVVDISVRVLRSDLATRSIVLKEEKTRFTEGGVSYVVAKVREAKGDPGLLIEGKKS